VAPAPPAPGHPEGRGRVAAQEQGFACATKRRRGPATIGLPHPRVRSRTTPTTPRMGSRSAPAPPAPPDPEPP